MITFLVFKLSWHLCDRDKIEPGTAWLFTGWAFLVDVFLAVMVYAAVLTWR